MSGSRLTRQSRGVAFGFSSAPARLASLAGLAALASLTALTSPTAQAGPPRLVRDINSTIIPVDASPSDFLDQGPWSFFVASDGVHASEPWATDGTLTGTVRLGAVNPVAFGVTGYQTTRVGALTYFFTNGVSSGSALWASDGTPARHAPRCRCQC